MGSRYIRANQLFGISSGMGSLWNRTPYNPMVSHKNSTLISPRNLIALRWNNCQLRTAASAGTLKILRMQNHYQHDNLLKKQYSDFVKKHGTDTDQCLKNNAGSVTEGESKLAEKNCKFDPHPFATHNSDMCDPGSGSSSSSDVHADNTTTSSTGSVTNVGGGSTTGSLKTPTSGFCAGISPAQPKKDPASKTSGGIAGSAMPDVKLPDRQQVLRVFFRVLAYIYDFSVLVINWIRKVICRYIIMNPTVQQHWRDLRAKMEAAKKS